MVQRVHKIISLHHAHVFLIKEINALFEKSIAQLNTCKLGSYMPYSASYLDLCTRGDTYHIPGV